MAGERIQLGRGTWEGAVRTPTRAEVNVGNIDRITHQADVHARTQAILNTYRTDLTNAGFQPTVISSIPDPPVNPPLPPPTPDEIAARAERVTAFNTVMVALTDQFWVSVETAYDLIKTTAEPFRRDTDIKRYRQRMR